LRVSALALTLFAGCGQQEGPSRAPEAGVPSNLTFSGDIAPIIFENCSGCHRQGEAGPFPFLNYEDVRGRAELVAFVTQSGYMPPFLPEPGWGEFTNERRLSEAQIRMIAEWVEDGAPEGDPAETPPLPQWTEGWQLGEPDLVIRMTQPYTLPAEGADIFRNFAIPIPIPGDRYVRAFEFRPGNARVVHHARMSLDKSDRSRRHDQEDPEAGFASSMFLDDIFDPDGHWIGWTPGKQPAMRPDDMAWKIEKGTDLMLEMHMLPTGKPETIQSSMGLFFTEQPPTRIPSILRLGSKVIDIPPGEKNYVIEDAYVLPVDVHVLNVYAHAHYLGKEMRSLASLPDGTEKKLLYIKGWDFDWQDEYQYAEPVFLPRGSEIRMSFRYDNSADNPENPYNPPVRVAYGWETSREMGDLWFQVLPASSEDLAVLREDFDRKERRAQIAGYEKQLEIDPGDYEKRNALANSYLEIGEHEKALAHFKQALRTKPDYEYAEFNLGLLYDSLGEPGEAMGHYRRAIEIRPEYPEAHNNLGVLLGARGERDQAIRHFRKAIKADPGHARANNNLGIELGSRGESEAALRHFRRALATNPDYAEAHNNLGITLGSMGKLDEAIPHFRKAIQLMPDYAEAFNNLGSVLGSQGKLDEAIRYFRAAVEADPDYEEAHKNLERALAARGKSD
jgi:tetratricopeptide (TPR) repeat protein/mono/diheme cytochrome c family protein